MNITLLQILFYGLIPLGIFSLITAIRLLRKMFFGNIVAEIPFTQRDAEIYLPAGGNYSIWQKGKMLKRTLVNQFEPQLADVITSEVIILHTSVFAPHVNGFDTGRMEWKRFVAPAGRYKLRLVEQPNNSLSGRMLAKLWPSGPIDYNQYWVQVRESQPAYITALAIPIIILSVACIIGGLVLAINARDVAAYLAW